MSALHHYTPQHRSNTPTCQRVVLAHVRATTNWSEVTCKWCLRLNPTAPRPSSGDGAAKEDGT